ncbi:acyltransferase family protein [Alteromonas facilis]|uniref:acyltransferase family protein n=1 Tax=Alteromonas facilis TaxID=2048004 RepID=UPI000C288F94|nr:acyltransferase family protein [Alteromonas facilis]
MKLNYRPDIDGLRAVAVLPVIFFHAGFDFFSGGYLGVDVFFVISGFLITNILLNELYDGRFSIVNFYERRARRILPALFVVLLATTIVGAIFMSPYEFKEYSQSLFSVVLFLSNIFFYLEIDYFSLAAEEMPLLHTWSLAIEEQYYLLFPPFLFIAYKFGVRIVLYFLVFIAILSFSLMLIQMDSVDNSAAFYWPITRAWELLAGSICAIFSSSRSRQFNYIADIGLLILLGSIILWPENTVHPNQLTLLPVVATCLIVLFPNENSISFKLLSREKVVFIGLISYSLYLWHQPVFAFLRMKTFGHPSLVIFSAAIVVTFFLAIVSYKYIETPFRNKARYTRAYVFYLSLFGISFFSLMGLTGHFTQGLPERFVYLEQFEDSIKHSAKRKECHASDRNYITPQDACIYFNHTNVKWATFGDSHTVEPAYALAEMLERKQIGLQHHSYSGCVPALNFTLKNREMCSQWLNETLTYLEQQSEVENVLVGFRYSYGIFGDNVGIYPQIPKAIELDIVDSSDINDNEKLELYWLNLSEIISRLVDSNKTVWLLDPIPELPVHISKGANPFSIYGKSTLLDLYRATSSEYYHKRHNFILDKLNTLNENKGVRRIRVYDLFCDEDGCPAVIDNKALYFDDDHLSVDGARILFDRLEKQTEFLLAN